MECVYETEDAEKRTGVRLSKDIVEVAGRAMEKNFTSLGEFVVICLCQSCYLLTICLYTPLIGPYVLPISEQAKVVFSLLHRQLARTMGWAKVSMYLPDFKRGIDHFCVHAGECRHWKVCVSVVCNGCVDGWCVQGDGGSSTVWRRI